MFVGFDGELFQNYIFLKCLQETIQHFYQPFTIYMKSKEVILLKRLFYHFINISSNAIQRQLNGGGKYLTFQLFKYAEKGTISILVIILTFPSFFTIKIHYFLIMNKKSKLCFIYNLILPEILLSFLFSLQKHPSIQIKYNIECITLLLTNTINPQQSNNKSKLLQNDQNICNSMRIIFRSNSHSKFSINHKQNDKFLKMHEKSSKRVKYMRIMSESEAKVVNIAQVRNLSFPQCQIIIEILTQSTKSMNHFANIHNKPSKISKMPSKQPLNNITALKMPRMMNLGLWGNRRLIDSKNHWNRQQIQHYISFLRSNFDLMQRTAEQKRIVKIYCLMEHTIPTKNYAQCRLHHRRMILKYKTNEQIIRNMQRKLKGQTSKMEQYKGLQVELDQAEHQTTQQKELWTIIDSQCWNNQPQPEYEFYTN